MTAATDTFKADTLTRFATRVNGLLNFITSRFPNGATELFAGDVSQAATAAREMIGFAWDIGIISDDDRLQIKCKVNTIEDIACAILSLRKIAEPSMDRQAADLVTALKLARTEAHNILASVIAKAN
jgi:hypothetical protein